MFFVTTFWFYMEFRAFSNICVTFSEGDVDLQIIIFSFSAEKFDKCYIMHADKKTVRA